MKPLVFVCSVVLGLCIYLPSPSLSAPIEVYGIEIVEYGRAVAETERRVEEKGTVLGYRTIIKNIKVVEQTDRIPSTIGTRFGIRYRITGSPQGDGVKIRKKMSLPGLKDPKTDKVIYSSEYELERQIGALLWTGYTFEEDWECVPGEWTIQLWYGEKKLAEKTFTVYRP